MECCSYYIILMMMINKFYLTLTNFANKLVLKFNLKNVFSIKKQKICCGCLSIYIRISMKKKIRMNKIK